MLKSLLQITLAALIWLGVTRAHGADDPSALFDQGNKQYEEGHFAEAAKKYEQAVASGQVSPALLFNLGNAQFKAGQRGPAVASYRAAAALAPRDPDIRANLRFARTVIAGGVEPPASGPAGWLNQLTLNEWAMLALLAVWLTGVLLIIGELRPKSRRTLRRWMRLSAGIAVLVAGLLTVVWRDRFDRHEAVVRVKQMVVRYGPLDESQSHFTLSDGSEVSIEDSKADWRKIRDINGRVGWVKADNLLPLDPNRTL